MAGVQTDPGSRGGIWLAVFLGVAVLGGPLVYSQVPPALRQIGGTSGSPTVLPGGRPTWTTDARTAVAASEEQVVRVRVVGNRKIPMEKILPQIRTRAGRPFDPELIEEDVRRLYKTGMFVNVKPYSQGVEGGREVVFEVYERPILQYVKYVGNQKIKKKRLAKEADIKAGDAMDPFAVEEGRRRLEEFYHSQGFSKARVTVVEGDKPSDSGAIYLINEGQKQRILWTRFVGNTIASDARLRTQIRSKPGVAWLIGGQVDRQQIEEDLDRLTAYYRSLGFFDARVGRYLEFNEAQNWLILTFVINEGPRYVVRNVSFIGNTKFSSQQLASQLKLKPGEFFNQADLRHDVVTIQDEYGGRGYVFADIKADPRCLEEPGKLDLVYDIREGQRCRVGKITPKIKEELPHTRITTVLNRLSLKPGDILDTREMRASERRLQASRLFEVDLPQGIAPRITFNPPTPEEMEAQTAGRRDRFRGQSPDPSLAEKPQPPQGQPQRAPSRTVPPIVRGQYSADPGWAVPSFDPGPDYRRRAGGYARMPYPASAAGSSLGPSESGEPARPHADLPGSVVTSQSLPAAQLPAADANGPPTRFFPNEQISYAEPGIVGGGPSPLGSPLDEQPPLYVPLDILAEGTKTGRLMLSVGINSDIGLLGSVIIDEQNFDIFRLPRSWQEIRDGTAWRGRGQRLRMEAVPGSEFHRYMVNFQEPYLLDTPVSLGLSGYFYSSRYLEWHEERVGGRLAWGYQFTADLSGVFAYRGAKVGIFDPIVPGIAELDEVLGDNALHGFELRLAHDTRDSAFLATQGHLVELSFEQVIGSFDYPRGEVDLRRYCMLRQRPDGSGRHVLGFRGQMAVTGSNTPIYDHYYIGGFSTLRGFDYRGASPRDAATSVAVGGEFMLLASAEYMFPITADDTIRAVVFCDTGTVEPTINDWTDNYRVSPGFGLRITIPKMGPAPIALDFAFPVSLASGDDVENFSFFIGFLR